MYLFLIRHGETAWNKEEVFRGRADPPLNERGIAQAGACARRLAGINLEAVYAGPLSRAQVTAVCIAGPHQLPVITEERLTDLDYGHWQGLSHNEVKERYPELYHLWETAPQRVSFPGGESLEEVRERGMAALMEIVRRHQGQVAVVSHRVVTKVLLLSLLGLDNSRFWHIAQDTCCFNIIEYNQEHGFIIRTLNDTCHLHPDEESLKTVDF